MENLQEKLKTFKNIEDLYEYLDLNAIKMGRIYNLATTWLTYKNITTSKIEKQYAHWEFECFSFSFIGSAIFSSSYSEGHNDTLIDKYPDLKEIQPDNIEYFKERANKTKSSLLRAIYNHLLWKGLPTKNRTYAGKAIVNYIDVIQDSCESKAQNDDELNLQIGRLFECLINLCNEVNLRIEDARNLTSFLLFKSNKIKFYTKHGMISEMLKYPKIFKKEQFKNTLAIYEKQIQESKKDDEYFMLVTIYIPIALKVSQKLNLDTKKWHNEMGDLYLKLADEETDEIRYWIKSLDYHKAIEAFRLGDNKERKKFVEQLYFELKAKIRLDKHRINFDEEEIKKLEEAQNEFKQIAKSFLLENSDTIYSILGGDVFFPKYANLLENSKSQEPSFLNYITSISFDMNKNIKTQTDIQNKLFYERYSQVLREKTLPIFHYILNFGIKSGHLTAENLLQYLAEKTWIGTPVAKNDLGGDLVQSSWIKLIAPSIIEYFNQVLAWNESKYYQPSFILCSDSLTLKIEGLMRSFCGQLNISTSHGNAKGVQEVLIHNILDNEDFKKHFNNDDIMLFSYLFKNEYGLNLRNNIAHCFYNENNYSSDLMLLLLASLLRLGKYNFREKNQSSSSG
jgi:hypothetical protein